MNIKTNMILGAVGSALGLAGTATQTNEILQTISLVITILGGIISFIVIPLLNWYLKAKKDNKITIDEIKEGAETLQQGLEDLQEHLPAEDKDHGDTKEH